MVKKKAEEIQLVFRNPEPKLVEAAGIGGEIQAATVAKLSEILEWFKEYQVSSIELSVEASVKTGGIIRLFVSAEGKGGMKVTLTPKKKP